jgi:hypothetical protein
MTPARLEFYQNPNYLTWLRAEASEIDTDGCSGVSGVRVECCYQHDLEFWYGRCARDAYSLMKRGIVADYWREAKRITFAGANANLRKCMQARSKFGLYSPLAVVRWLGVKFMPKSRNAWDAHRKREEAEHAFV